MIKAINTIISRSGYPVFTPNQVLSKDDLNHLVNYLDEQNRLTRAYLIGVGIVCGLEVSSTYETAQAQIQISAGCGITSEGYAIALATTTLTHYQAEQLVSAALFAPSQKLEQEVSTALPANYKVIELFEQSSDKRIPLPQAETEFADFLSDRILVVVCELEDVQRDFCRLDYNNLSQERSLLYRFFLLPQTQKPDRDKEAIAAQTLLKTGFQIDQLPSYWQGVDPEAVFTARNHYLQEFDLELQQFRDFAPKVQRFGYARSEQFGKSVDLTKISDYKTFRDNYYLICQNAIAAIDNAFPQLYRLFSPFFSSFHPNSTVDFSNLKQRLELLLEAIKPQEIRQQTVPPEKVEPTYALQYFYDYLSQLVAAYDELAQAAFDLMDDCAPDTQRFPKFLMLGIVPSPNQALKIYEPASPYRSHFTQPPIYNGNQQRVKQVRHLCDRLLNLCQEDSFYLLPFSDTPLKITPSKDSSVPLSEQAIPYYFNYSQVYRYWSYDAYRKGRSHLLPAYFTLKEDDKTASITFSEQLRYTPIFFTKLSSLENVSHQVENSYIPKREDLAYRLDSHNFYRIEGHIGKANGDALKRIQEYQQRYNLAFDVITLKLGSQASLQDLNISGQFDDLEADFRRLKETFQKLWIKYATEPKNVLLHTLKQVFFDQPSLTVINSSQLFNPILEIARKPEALEFVKGNTNQGYRLFVRDKNNTRIARYVTQVANTEGNSLNNFNDLSIDFSGLTDDAIDQEKQRIAKEIAAGFSLSKVTYGLVTDAPASPSKYHLKLSTEDVLNLPSPNPQSPLILLSLNHFAVSVDQENQPIIKQSEFQDVETLYSLLRDVPAPMGNSQAAEELNYFELIELIDAYHQRLEKLMQLHLFHKFAQQHPGVEHLGGVPKGGTFILVYVDGEEIEELLAADKDPAIYKLRSLRTASIQKTASFPPAAPQELISSWEKLFQELQKRQDVVIGDFCLPYRCSSDTPAVSYVLARPRPIILLEKTVFCEGDRHKYKFILEPGGGTVRGEGVVFEGSKQLFQPSSIDQASKEDLAKGLEVTITFAYAVDDTYDTLTVSIFPLPDAGFQIGGDSHKTSFCVNDDSVSLNPKHLGGTFRVLAGEEDISADALNTESHPLHLIPHAVKLGNADSIQITIEHTITSDQGCTNSAQQAVTIFALPDAGFQVGSEANKTSFCANDTPVSLTLKLMGGTFQVLDDKGNVIEDAIANNQFHPSLVKLGEDETHKVITLKYTITSEQGCTNSTQQTLTIFALPDAGFQVGSEANKINFCTNDAPLALTPKLTGGTFRVLVGEEDISTDVLNSQSNPPQLIPRAVKLGDAKQLTLTVEYTVISENGCTNQSLYNLTMHQVPVADFQAEIAQIDANGFSIRVFDIQPAQETSFSFVWEQPSGRSNISNPGNSDFIISYNYDFNTWVAGAEVSITLRVNTPPTLGSCSSEPVTKKIAIPFVGVQGFNLLTISNNQVIERTTLESDRTFRISDFNPNNEYAIEAVTVPATVDSIVFTYTAPADDAKVSTLVNTPYRLPDGWQTIVGIHRIQAQPFREVNGGLWEGVASTVIIRINDSEPDTNTPTPSTPKSATLLNRLRVLFEMRDSHITEDKAVNPYREPAKTLVSYYRPVSDEYKIKPYHILALSVATLLFIVGWSYSSSKQPEYQQNYYHPQNRGQ